jgi:hypothetical protein
VKAVPDPWAELSQALEALAASGSADVREDGEWLADLAEIQVSRVGLNENWRLGIKVAFRR